MVSRQSQAVVNQTHAVKPIKPSRFAPAHRSASNPRMGNQAAQRLLRDGVIQAKLTVNQPGDVHEREADRVADQVLAAPRIQRFTGQPSALAGTAPASVDRVIASPGRPLDPALQQDMEQRFGHDFSQVRVHSGVVAEQSACDVNANAYTVGHDIAFGAGRFAPGTIEGRRLLAHELTHVVQQSGADGNRVGQSNGTPGLSPTYATDPAEREADHVATRVASGQSAGPIRATTSNALHAQPKPGPSKKVDWEPEVEADTRSAHVKVGKTVSLKFHVSNERTAPKGTTFDWRGMRLEQSAAITMVGFSDHVGAHASLVVKGQTAGISEVGTTVYFKTPGAQEDYKYTPLVRVEVGSAIQAAEAELGQIEKLRGQDKKVDPSRESAAQQEAVAAGQQTLGKASRAGGNEIDQIITSVRDGISKIENARYRGYQDALTHLNLTQLDEKEQAGNVRSFGLSLAGNLIWALSGLIAISPIGQGGLAIFSVLQAARAAKLATAVGVGGAMLAQFANGLPSGGSGGGNVSSPLILLQQKLNQFNSDLFNKMRSDLYLTLLAALDNSPPGRDVDAQQYAGQLETGIRHVLFGGYLENGGATGNQINADVIQIDARDQLLRRLIVTSGKISGKGIASTKRDEQGLGKVVKQAVDLVGGAKALELGEYELVVEQLLRAARELRLEGLPKVDSDQMRGDFAGSDAVVLSARGADKQLFPEWTSLGGLELEVSNYGRIPYPDLGTRITGFDGIGYPEVLFMKIRKKDLKSADIGKNGARVYSAQEIWIRVRDDTGLFNEMTRGRPSLDQSRELWLIYNI